MPIGHALCDGKAQAAALPLGIGAAVKPIAHARKFGFGDAGAGIPHFERHACTVSP